MGDASQRQLKKRIERLLVSSDIDAMLAELANHPPSLLLNGLFASICQADEQRKWRAVTAMGATVSRLADQEMEAARIVMRRFMWSLNDESGGIGWGVPEAMAECLASHQGLAEEYTHILVAFMREDGFYLELPALQRGLMWGIGRLAQARPTLLHKWQAGRYLLPYLDSDDLTVRTLAARALGILGVQQASPAIEQLLDSPGQISLYEDRRLSMVEIATLARQAQERLKAA